MALLTKEDIKVENSIDTTDWDTLIDSLAVAVQGLFESQTRRKYESQSFTEYYDGGRYSNKLFLRNIPITEFTSLHDDTEWEYGDDTLISTSDYVVDLRTGIVSYNGPFSKGFQNIKAVYTAGYTTLTLPAGIKEIWVRQASVWYRNAKNKDHGKAVISQVGGGTITMSSMMEGMLPEWVALVEQEKNYNV